MNDESDSEDDRPKVLLVGATPRDARIVSCGLERESISMTVAADVRAAIARLTRASDGRSTVDFPDLVVLDLTTTPSEGLTVLSAVQTSPRLQTLPTIAIVEQTPPAPDLRARLQAVHREGVNGYVSKAESAGAYADAVERMAAFWFGRVSSPPESLYSTSTSRQYD